MSDQKERPILFNGAMVRAILEGRKTVTRRPVKGGQIPTECPDEKDPAFRCSAIGQRDRRYGFNVFGATEGECAKQLAEYGRCPYGLPGDRLWVRETWYCDHFEVLSGPYLKPDDLNVSEAREYGALVYAADGLTPYEAEQPVWKPSIHMPRWASRIQLEITAVRVERLQDITYEQAAAEGIHRHNRMWSATDEGSACHKYPEPAFRDLWLSTGGDWDANPWVWVVEFKRIDQHANPSARPGDPR